MWKRSEMNSIGKRQELNIETLMEKYSAKDLWEYNVQRNTVEKTELLRKGPTLLFLKTAPGQTYGTFGILELSLISA